MYLVQTFKFRFGEFSDFFNGDMITGRGVQNLKERVVYFLYIDGKITGPYKTYSNGSDLGQFMDMYSKVLDHKVLVIEPRAVAQEVATYKLYLRVASYDDIERNTIFYEHRDKKLFGPFALVTDISVYDTHLIQRINEGKIFVINERQKFEL